eukprot:894831-Prorocentrum_lima.AAC.1
MKRSLDMLQREPIAAPMEVCLHVEEDHLGASRMAEDPSLESASWEPLDSLARKRQKGRPSDRQL